MYLVLSSGFRLECYVKYVENRGFCSCWKHQGHQSQVFFILKGCTHVLVREVAIHIKNEIYISYAQRLLWKWSLPSLDLFPLCPFIFHIFLSSFSSHLRLYFMLWVLCGCDPSVYLLFFCSFSNLSVVLIVLLFDNLNLNVIKIMMSPEHISIILNDVLLLVKQL